MWAAANSGLVRGNDLGHPGGLGGIFLTPFFLLNGTALLRAFFSEKSTASLFPSVETQLAHFVFLLLVEPNAAHPASTFPSTAAAHHHSQCPWFYFIFYSAKKLPFGSTTMFCFLAKISPQLNVEHNPIVVPVTLPLAGGRGKHPAFGFRFFCPRRQPGTLCRLGKWLLAEPKKKGHKKKPALGQKGVTKKANRRRKKVIKKHGRLFVWSA